VVASGSAPLSYQWMKNGIALANGGIVNGATAATLTLTGVGSSDAGNYSVVVSNSAGSATSTAATLTIIGPAPPTITTNPQNTSVGMGQSASFSVAAAG